MCSLKTFSKLTLGGFKHRTTVRRCELHIFSNLGPVLVIVRPYHYNELGGHCSQLVVSLFCQETG